MAVELNYQLVGKRLRAIRKKRGFTQEQLAEMAGISSQHCSGIETGAAKVSLPALIQLCNALDTTPDELLLDSVPAAAKPGLMREVETVFADATADELYLMLALAKSVKEAVRVKGLLANR
ncbi:MAG: helix-turn-helix transcriptional regulator [Oscillospiraceae bacterium]|jgi:transcriptional regulator with XRE-family HTH domain|nr:helix-turn-helix transcriptional regulator [Oscillospiraceae bacterium]